MLMAGEGEEREVARVGGRVRRIFFYCIDQFTLNFNGKVNRGTILANRVIGWVPLESLSICGYQILHSVIVWVPYWNFTLLNIFEINN